jgi:hypothetical protein
MMFLEELATASRMRRAHGKLMERKPVSVSHTTRPHAITQGSGIQYVGYHQQVQSVNLPQLVLLLLYIREHRYDAAVEIAFLQA